MNKAEFVTAVAEHLDADRKVAAAAVDGVLDTIIRTVHSGDSVTLTGFGVFERRDRAARSARNPQTGQPIQIAATSVPAFRPGTVFREVISGARVPASDRAARPSGPRTSRPSTPRSSTPRSTKEASVAVRGARSATGVVTDQAPAPAKSKADKAKAQKGSGKSGKGAAKAGKAKPDAKNDKTVSAKAGKKKSKK